MGRSRNRHRCVTDQPQSNILQSPPHEKTDTMTIIVAIGWLYVVMMMAAVSDTLLKGIVRLLFLGVLPVGLLLWIKLKRYRARAEAAKEVTGDE
jgi:type VI protein secretion system component VasK